MSDSHKIAHEQIDLMQDGPVSEAMASLCFAMAATAGQTASQSELSAKDTLRAMRLTAVLLLNLAESFGRNPHDWSVFQ